MSTLIQSTIIKCQNELTNFSTGDVLCVVVPFFVLFFEAEAGFHYAAYIAQANGWP
jgi:hypothetical protein